MILMVDNIKKEIISKGNVSVLVSLDLKNDFPSVHSEKFWNKMKEEFQVSDYWLRDYFNDSKQFVEIDMKKSDVIANPTGLVQESVLGPKFFTFFINDIVKVLTFAKIQFLWMIVILCL